ncbi:MAG: hypothetical protein FJ088_13895, partial [Deltaproteobacteria bacterium]|nr:hypothetical protein [Deltaproteobacteria bacterium]
MQISRYTILFPILISLLTCTETRVEYVPCLDVIIGDHEETVSDLFDIPIDQELYIEPPPDFGKKCDKNTDCLSGLCVEGVDGFLCSVKCIEDCPAGFVCKSVAIFPDVIFGCVPEGVSLCKPCKQDSQCSGGLCMALKEGNYCTRNCANTGCPERYKCVEITKENGDVTKECVPENGSCTCNVTSENNERPCVNKNEIGTCLGFEKCDVNLGWTGCTAATPAAEVCDGVDNDCNGVADDQPAPPVEECANENEFGKCVGTWVCKGLNGWDCLAEIPHAEACNFIDDDCDGLSDEDFKVPDTNK